MVAVEHELPIVEAAASADAIPFSLRRRGGSPRQVLAIALIGTLVLAVFTSRDLSAWLERFGDGPMIAPLQHAAGEWNDAMDRFGLTWPQKQLRLAIRRALDWEWGSLP